MYQGSFTSTWALLPLLALLCPLDKEVLDPDWDSLVCNTQEC